MGERIDCSIQRVNPLDDPEWDNHLSACPQATFFLGSAWTRVLHSTYRFRPCYFVGAAPNNTRSILPIMEVDSWLTGRRAISLPFTDECEALCVDSASFRGLYRAALDEASARGWKTLELRGGRSQLADAPASVSFYGHELTLSPDVEAIFARFDSSVRRAVRRAERSAVTIEFSQSLEGTRAFHGLLCKTRQRHGLPPQPLRFFENIQRHIFARNQGCIVLARLDGVAVAGAVFFQFGRKVLYKFGASDEAFQHLRPNNLVMWRAIECFARAGFDVLDFGRTSLTNNGLRRFKLGWGTRERLIDYVKYDCRVGKFMTGRDSSSGWHNRLFRHLPGFLSRMIGSAAYKHVA